MLPGGVVPSLKPAESLARLRGCGWGRGGWLHASWGQKQRGQEDCVPFQRGPCLFPVLTQLQRNSVLAIYGDVLNRVRRCFKPCPMYCQIFSAVGVRMCVCACVCAHACVRACVCICVCVWGGAEREGLNQIIMAAGLNQVNKVKNVSLLSPRNIPRPQTPSSGRSLNRCGTSSATSPSQCGTRHVGLKRNFPLKGLTFWLTL